MTKSSSVKSLSSTYATIVAKARPATVCRRVLWLQPPNAEWPPAERLRAQLTAVGLLVYTLAFHPAPGEACSAFDLIVLCSGTQTPAEVAANVAQIRTFNVAPILMLTDQEPMEWLLATLPVGADAVLTIQMPEELIVARCIALLRRWPPAS